MRQILCYGDSNTWGLIPGTNERYPWGVRWTSLLQEKLRDRDVHVIEEGLCGRTTIFEDAYRGSRNGLKTLPMILESHAPIDAAVIMLGTNDCKSIYKASAFQITEGLAQCIEKLREYLPPERILIVSPISLGARVWEHGFDQEFDRRSVDTAMHLKNTYQAASQEIGTCFLAASDYAAPSETDQEHMEPAGHKALAEAIFQVMENILC